MNPTFQTGTCTVNSQQRMLHETSGMTEQYVNIGLEKNQTAKFQQRDGLAGGPEGDWREICECQDQLAILEDSICRRGAVFCSCLEAQIVSVRLVP